MVCRKNCKSEHSGSTAGGGAEELVGAAAGAGEAVRAESASGGGAQN